MKTNKTNLIIAIIIGCIFSSCSNTADFDGKWIEEKEQNDFLEISKIDDQLFSVDYDNESYSAKIESKNLMSLLDSDLSVLFNPKEKKIVFNGNTFIPYNGTFGQSFVGYWIHPIYGGEESVEIKTSHTGYSIEYNNMSGAWAKGNLRYVKYEEENNGHLEGFMSGASESGKWSENLRIYIENDGLLRVNDWEKLKLSDE